MSQPAPPRHDSLVDAQFGPQAQAYVASAVHAAGPDLDRLEEIARTARPRRALDVGCGGGHVAYRLAAHAGEVTACDLSEDMLAAVRTAAKARGLDNVVTQQAAAEHLPFADGSFDFVATRFSAHHWRSLTAGLAEARRVAKPGAPAVFIDAIASGHPLLDSHLQAIELLRDASHVRDYAAGEWIAGVERAGFLVEQVWRHQARMEFASWTERMRTPQLQRDAIRALQKLASAEVRDHFGLEDDGSFQLDVITIQARAVD